LYGLSAFLALATSLLLPHFWNWASWSALEQGIVSFCLSLTAYTIIEKFYKHFSKQNSSWNKYDYIKLNNYLLQIQQNEIALLHKIWVDDKKCPMLDPDESGYLSLSRNNIIETKFDNPMKIPHGHMQSKSFYPTSLSNIAFKVIKKNRKIRKSIIKADYNFSRNRNK
jgi:hypothetical protein